MFKLSVIWKFRLIVPVLYLLGCAGAGKAAEPLTIGGISPVLPQVPPTTPREGQDANFNWQSAKELPPVASFIDTLKGNDAAVQVFVGQGRILTTKGDIATDHGAAVVATADPTILDFEVMPNSRMLRLLGLRSGVTDLSITLSNGENYSFEVHVMYDIELMTAQLRQVFPDADIRLAQLREHVIVEGQARSAEQVTQILQLLEAYVRSIQVEKRVKGESAADTETPPKPTKQPEEPKSPQGGDSPPSEDGGGDAAGDEVGGVPQTDVKFNPPQIINLIRVPGVQQVMIQVRFAELDRTALREVGADLGITSNSGNAILGTQIGGAVVQSLAELGAGGVTGSALTASSGSTTAFGIFPGADVEFALRLLRQNSVARVLAEPNLMALSGHKANFLAGGEFPIPVPQGGSGFSNTTIEFREFGVRLDFVPYVMDDQTIRLSVVPEVSDTDFSLSTTLVPGGNPVPGLTTRRASTTVQLREGQTLAIAGLLQVKLDGNTGRVPGLGDLPYLGAFFSNTSHKSVEKELLVLVTPYLVEPINASQRVSLPGEEILEPTDKELYLLNRMEGRTGQYHRSTTEYEPLIKRMLINYEQKCMNGPCGFSR